MRYLLLVLTVLLAWSSPAAAQTVAMNYAADWYFAGATAPFHMSGVVADENNCDPNGVLPSVPNNVVNPGTMWWAHDPDGTGPMVPWVCTIDISTIVSPFVRGSYFARMRAIDPALAGDPNVSDTSPDSANSNPFGVVGAPVAPGAPVIRQ